MNTLASFCDVIIMDWATDVNEYPTFTLWVLTNLHCLDDWLNMLSTRKTSALISSRIVEMELLSGSSRLNCADTSGPAKCHAKWRSWVWLQVILTRFPRPIRTCSSGSRCRATPGGCRWRRRSRTRSEKKSQPSGSLDQGTLTLILKGERLTSLSWLFWTRLFWNCFLQWHSWFLNSEDKKVSRTFPLQKLV